MKHHEVLWAPTDTYTGIINGELRDERLDWPNLGYFDPEPAFKSVVKDRDTSVEYLHCPAVQKYYRNTFTLRCPVDLTLQVVTMPDGQKDLRTLEFDQDFYDLHITNRLHQNKFYSMASLEFGYVFMSETPLIMEMVPAMLGTANVTENIRIIPAAFDVSKWYRPVCPAFEIIDDRIPLRFKRGDIICNIRFNTEHNVVLNRVAIDDALKNSLTAFAKIKHYVPGNTLEKNYEMASSFIGLIKQRLFKPKKQCPFKFLFDKNK